MMPAALPHPVPSPVMFCLSVAHMTKDGNLWNHETKTNLLPPLSCFSESLGQSQLTQDTMIYLSVSPYMDTG